MRRRPGRAASDRGAVTAELALAMPLLLAVTAALAWLLVVGVAQVRTVDAAREVARAVARGDAEADALALGRRIGPAGLRLRVSRSDGRVVVEATGRVAGPGGLLRRAGVTVRARSVAVEERDDGAGADVGAPP